MRHPLAAILLLALAGCAAAGARPARPLEVAAVRDGGAWTAEFRFPRRERAWVFTWS